MEKIITSTNNSLVKEAKSLLDKKYRKKYGKFLVDGEKLVREAINKGLKIDRIFIDQEKYDAFRYFLDNFGGEKILVSSQVIKILTENQAPQGIIAEVFIPAKNIDQTAGDILVLDRIQDPGNLGTMLRTAVATGINNIALIDSVDVFSPKVVRSSSGAVFSLNLYMASEDELIENCKVNEKILLVADMNGENVFKTKSKFQNFALVIGNEGQGVSDNFKKCGKLISLPMKSEMESLNAGVSASVLMYYLKGESI